MNIQIERHRGDADNMRRRFESLIDCLEQAFFWEAETEAVQISYVSAQAEGILGFSRENCLTKRDFWKKRTHPEDRVKLAETFRRVRATGTGQCCDHRCVTADHRVVWLRTRVHLGGDPKAPILRGVSVVVSTAKKAEIAIQNHIEFNHAVAESVKEGVIAVDRRGFITFFSSTAEQLLGWKQEESLGVGVQAILKVHNEAGSTLLAKGTPPLEAMRRNRTVKRDDYLFRRRYGSPFPALCTAIPLRREGRVSGAVLVFEDVTEPGKLQRSMQDSEEYFHEVMQNMPQLAWTMRPSGSADFVNHRWLIYTGQTLEYIRSTHQAWRDALHPDDKERVGRLYSQRADNDMCFATEVRIRRAADGAYRWHLFRCSPLRDARKEVGMFLITCTDVDDAKRGEDFLRHANHRKEELLALLGHELRDPLAPIANAAHLLRVGDPAMQRRAGIIIERQADRMAHLVDELLSLVHLSTGKIELDRQWCDVREIVKGGIEKARASIDQRRHKFSLHLPPEAVYVHADASRIEQAITQLLNNAANMTPNGRMGVAVMRDSQDAVLRVWDNGPRIAEDILPQILGNFTQRKQSVDRSKGGLSIGLALVRDIVESHGGTVKAETATAQGNAFVIRLASRSTDPRLEDVTTGTVRPRQQLRILVVDDNVDIADSLAMLLRAAKHMVRIAYDGSAAINVAMDFQPDVIFLDIGLPHVDGNEVAKYVRREPILRKTTLVALTGYGQVADRERSMAAGFDHHLTKPAKIGDIERILRTHHW